MVTYDFPYMLPNGAAIRSLPNGLRLDQRIKYEALALSCDIITSSYLSLETTAERYADFSEAPGFAHVQMFKDAWVITHEVFLIHKMLKRSIQGQPGPLQQRFIDLSHAAYELRRGRDHLHDSIQNHASKTSKREPIYGTLSWFRAEQPAPKNMPSGRVTILSAGSVIPENIQRSFGFPTIYMSDRIIEGFALHAFNHKFDISQTLRALYIVMKNIEEDIKSGIRKLHEEFGEDSVLARPVLAYGQPMIWDIKHKHLEGSQYQTQMHVIYPANIRLTGYPTGIIDKD